MSEQITPGPTYDERYVDGMLFLTPKHPLAGVFEAAWRTPGVWVELRRTANPKAARRVVAKLKINNKSFPRGTYEVRSRTDPNTGQGVAQVMCLDQDSPYILLSGPRGKPGRDQQLPTVADSGVDAPA